MKKLIVTADDYGVFDCVNKGVIQAVKKGKVNSVAVLTNYKDSVSNTERLLAEADNSNQEVDIGCHLTITSGKPVTDKVSFLCKGNYFRAYNEFRNDVTDNVRKKALSDELHAQIDVLENKGIKVKHLTCHHNSLTLLPGHFDVYLKVAHDRNLPMRSPNLVPEERQKNYLRVLRFQLIDDLSRQDRLAIKRFGDEIVAYFNAHAHKVNAPGLLEGRHYGPLPGFPILDIGVARRVRRKQNLLDELFSEYRLTQFDSMELMLHLADGDVNEVVKERLDYPGVDPAYFDSRVIELKSILKYGVEKLPGIEMRTWTKCFANVPPVNA